MPPWLQPRWRWVVPFVAAGNPAEEGNERRPWTKWDVSCWTLSTEDSGRACPAFSVASRFSI